jgi:hypothetical protein
VPNDVIRSPPPHTHTQNQPLAHSLLPSHTYSNSIRNSIRSTVDVTKIKINGLRWSRVFVCVCVCVCKALPHSILLKLKHVNVYKQCHTSIALAFQRSGPRHVPITCLPSDVLRGVAPAACRQPQALSARHLLWGPALQSDTFLIQIQRYIAALTCWFRQWRYEIVH